MATTLLVERAGNGGNGKDKGSAQKRNRRDGSRAFVRSSCPAARCYLRLSRQIGRGGVRVHGHGGITFLNTDRQATCMLAMRIVRMAQIRRLSTNSKTEKADRRRKTTIFEQTERTPTATGAGKSTRQSLAPTRPTTSKRALSDLLQPNGDGKRLMAGLSSCFGRLRAFPCWRFPPIPNGVLSCSLGKFSQHARFAKPSRLAHNCLSLTHLKGPPWNRRK